MISKDKSEVEVEKILEKMFTYADNKDLNINRLRNLIVNPEILRVLIHQLYSMDNQAKVTFYPTQMTTIAKVAEIYSLNSLNCCILSKRDK